MSILKVILLPSNYLLIEPPISSEYSQSFLVLKPQKVKIQKKQMVLSEDLTEREGLSPHMIS
jgi:hypothetical protein